MVSAEFVVAPDKEAMSRVEDPVIDVFAIVRVKSAFAASETVVKVIDPTRPLHVTVPLAAPDPVTGVKRTPVPEVDATKFPFVAVIAPRVAVIVVAAVRDPETLGDPVKAGLAPVAPASNVPVAPTESATMGEVPSPTKTPCAVNVLAPVPPLATAKIPPLEVEIAT